ncbi:DUF4405 domain-containing protein [Geovibrio thiophilus]|uniref:DUF4405 domain-containing protein n=1 Tax=Geovibrio thiophilus TaxID=139438 RepID=A0A3R5V0G8_9BACT|nr:DUF4405 domain-containing protein [Geovibrio thiophilus]QAR34179.1 DUF4405 domain-containing protein [Geovibrio thiophilus]
MFKKVLRKTVSLTALFSFIVLVFSGAVIMLTPPGRLAEWTVWRVFGLTKEQHTDMHLTTACLFLITMILHLWLNWKSVWAYLKGKTAVKISRELAVSAALTVLIVWGTLAAIPPFSTGLKALADYKENYEDTIENPPFGHAELAPLDGLITKMGFELEQSLVLLEEEGISVGNPSDSLKKIAAANRTSPAKIYRIIKSTKKENDETPLPVQEEPISGLGKMNLDTLAGKIGMEPEKAVELLKAKGIEATADEKVKDIAEKAGILPMDIYDYLKENM